MINLKSNKFQSYQNLVLGIFHLMPIYIFEDSNIFNKLLTSKFLTIGNCPNGKFHFYDKYVCNAHK